MAITKRIDNPNYRKDLIIYANRISASAATLGRALNCRRWLVERPRLKGGKINQNRVVVNWGTTISPNWLGAANFVLNDFGRVRSSISKVESHAAFIAAGVPTLELSVSHDEASQWHSGGSSVLIRRDGLAGGKGIRIVGPNEAFPGVQGGYFYTRYFPKTHEYRVHVFNPSKGSTEHVERPLQGAERGGTVYQGGVIDITQKKRVVRGDGLPLEGASRSIYQRIVRSHANGWVHAHGDLHLPPEALVVIQKAATDAVRSLGLDFGAVDILARDSKKKPNVLRQLAVCEVNTAPGLENQVTIEAYRKAILEYANAFR